MRLYCSSFRLGDRTDLLVDLVRRSPESLDSPGSPRVAVVANACDTGPVERRPEAVALELTALQGLGFAPYEVDLRDFDASTTTLATELAGCAALWVRGGNAFTLRMAMARSGADHLIPQLLRDDALVYAGYSAGPCVLAPTLRGLELCDEPADTVELYGPELVWDGLGVLDRPFVPHLDTPGHVETELVAKVAALYRRQGTPYWGLRDGQVLVVDGALSAAAVV